MSKGFLSLFAGGKRKRKRRRKTKWIYDGTSLYFVSDIIIDVYLIFNPPNSLSRQILITIILTEAQRKPRRWAWGEEWS